MKKIFVFIMFMFLITPAQAQVIFQNSRPVGCYDTLTIHRVNGPVYVTNDRNNTYKDVTGVDTVGGAVAALYVNDEPMAVKLQTKGLCETYTYTPNF